MAFKSDKSLLPHAGKELIIGNSKSTHKPESTRKPESAREPEPESRELANQQLANMSIEELCE